MKTKILSMNYQTGKLEPVRSSVLQINQIVWLNGYGQNERYHKREAVYDVQNSTFNNERQYKLVNLDDFTKSIKNAYEIKPASEIFGIGTYYTPGDFADPEEITEALSRANQLEKDLKLKSEELEKQNDLIKEKGRLIFQANKPESTKAVIIAEFRENESDCTTDYFGYSTKKTVILAFSDHTRDLFPEMRKAAEVFEETAHLGRGKGIFKPVILINEDFYDNGYHYHHGTRSHWHSELTEGKIFQTEKECKEYIDKQEPLLPINFEEKPISFIWDIISIEIEHREKWSMGAGYYLGDSKYAGWIVRKEHYYKDENYYLNAGKDGCFLAFKNDGKKDANLLKAEELINPYNASVRINAIKNGIEIVFSKKPAQAVLDTLKANGWRWSKFGGLWYNKNNQDNFIFANQLVKD
jgi:hypothetical protein